MYIGNIHRKNCHSETSFAQKACHLKTHQFDRRDEASSTLKNQLNLADSAFLCDHGIRKCDA